MNRKVIKPVVLSGLFLAALIVFSIITNQDNKDMTTAMKEATLPIVQFYEGNNSVAQLHGYVSEMNITKMRDGIVPVDHTRLLPLKINTYGQKIRGIAYEIRSLDDSRLVAKGNAQEIKEKNNEISANLKIQNILGKGEEYELIVILASGKNKIRYYTRLMQTQNDDTQACMDFALQFHEYTFRDDANKFIPKYMDAATGDTSTLNYVDLSCTLNQITWADLKPEQMGEPEASFKEINDSYDVITLRYVVTTKGTGGETEYYNVEEYYRLRMTESRMYVLNFERTLNQIFRGENRFITDNNQIQLGIRDKNIEYAVSETGDVIAFVQQGELWCFDRVNNKIVQVFSFLGAEGINARDNWDQHDIKIARVDEAGSIDFVVYGYMNRGDHEGEVGTAVYHYDGLVHTIEEEIFIPSDVSYEILKAQMGQLMYVNEKGTFYLIMDQKLYSIDTDKRTPEVLVKDLKESCYKVSESNQYFAWVDSDKEYKSDVIHLMNLKNASVYDIKAKKGAYILPLGFIDEDFIYGAAKKDKVMVAAAGNTVFPMKNLTIMDTSENSHSILKTYEPSRGSIGSISVEDYTITIHLIKKSGGHYVAAGTDAIMNREGDTEEKVTVGSTVTDRKETQYQLMMKNGADASKIKMLTSKSVLLENPRDVSVKNKESQEYFYVYKKGDVLLATDEIADAIVCANNHMGVVVDSKQQYVWMRARKSAQTAFSSLKVNDADKSSSSVVQAVSAMLNYRGNGLSVKELIDNGGTPKSAIENTLKDSVVLDISGCTVEEILFYVSKGSPVFAMTGTDSAVLVTGYTSGSIYYYDPQTHSTRSKSYKDADDWFRKAGYIFFTYFWTVNFHCKNEQLRTRFYG